MFRKIDDFENRWAFESDTTRKTLAGLTDDCLTNPEAEGHWTLGQIANHLAIVIPVIGSYAGLEFPGAPATDAAPQPSSAKAVCDAYDANAIRLIEQVKQKWTDADLEITDTIFGYQWARGFTLDMIISHQAHHRGQITVLLRQAGIVFPGIYGPTKEEMAGMQAQAH